MLVYCNRLFIENTGTAFPEAVSAIGTWLSKKTFDFVTEDHLADGFCRRLKDGKSVQVWSTWSRSSDFPRICAVRFAHPDRDVRGRQWVTEVGLRHLSVQHHLELTILLETKDISPRAAGTIPRVTRPGLLRDILVHCTLRDRTPGLDYHILRNQAAAGFKHRVLDPHRDHCIVLVSPRPDTKETFVDLNYLCSLLVGLAEVVLLQSPGSPLFRIVLGPSFSAWDGGINVIYPPLKAADCHIHSYILPSRLTNWSTEDDGTLEQFILALVTHRSNCPLSLAHISPAEVQLAILRKQIKMLQDADRDRLSGENELIRLYDEEIVALSTRLREQHEQIKAADDLYQTVQTELEALQSRYTFFDYQRLRTLYPRLSVASPPICFSSLDEVAELVQARFADRIVLTTRARKSLWESPFWEFYKVYRAFEILAYSFVELFRNNVEMDSVGEDLARDGIEYSAAMSDVTIGKYKDYSATYKGRRADMNRHLKIGSSRDPARGFRIHFEWDDEEKKVVIHHAGKHLQTQGTRS